MDGRREGCASSHVNLVFIGPNGCGKSTVAGRLIANCNAIDERSLERIASEAAACGQEDRRYAWILDKLRTERDRGGTVYIAMWRLNSPRCRFLIIDAPGHDDFAKDTVTAMSQADVAVLVVTAVKSDLDEGNACEIQIREHTLLAYTLGMRRLVVCVNKMDVEGVGYSKDHFESAIAVVQEDLRNVGYATENVFFVPTSGLSGDNITTRSGRTSWYTGPTLLEALHSTVDLGQQPERPLRMPLREVMQIGGTGVVTVGRIETGSLRPGMRLVLMPGNVEAQVFSIEMHHEKMEEAVRGDNVNIHVDACMKDLHRGMVGSAAEDNPARECRTFLAQVIVLSAPRAGEILTGCELVVDCHTAQVPCVFEEILSRTDRRTGKVLEMSPKTLHAGDAATVRLRPSAAMCVEPFVDYPPLGRFAVRDQKTTVAVGVVQEVEFVQPQDLAPVTKSTSQRKVLCAAKPKMPSRIVSNAAPARHAADGDGDTTDASPKLAPAPYPASSPFAAFGDVTRNRVKEVKWRPRLESPREGTF